jgi:hypothetical protein
MRTFHAADDLSDQGEKLEVQEQFVAQATQVLQEFFSRRKTPFHFRQLQVLFETQFFHIATAKAIYRLLDDGYLDKKVLQAGANKATFVFPSYLLDSAESERKLLTHIESKAKIIALFDNASISKDLGTHFEGLVKYELRVHGLKIISKGKNEYNGRKWPGGKANLDYIAEGPNKVAFGIQAKNELKSIEQSELFTQIQICSHLKIKPLFIVRYMPFSFTPLIKQNRGFLAVLGNQLWPIGHGQRCETIKRRMSVTIPESLRKLAPKIRSEWPVEIRADIPEGTSKHLNYWITTGKYPEPTS